MICKGEEIIGVALSSKDASASALALETKNQNLPRIGIVTHFHQRRLEEIYRRLKTMQIESNPTATAEWVFVGVFERGPQDQCKGSHGALGASAEADNLEALDVVILKRVGHLVEEVRRWLREVVGEVGSAEAFEALCGGPPELGIAYEVICVKR